SIGVADASTQHAPPTPPLPLVFSMGVHASAGRDKLTLITSPGLQSLGPWIEQLVAESTGKLGRGLLPVVGEPIGPASQYGQDRAVVAILVPGDAETARLADAAETAGHPVFRM